MVTRKRFWHSIVKMCDVDLNNGGEMGQRGQSGQKGLTGI